MVIYKAGIAAGLAFTFSSVVMTVLLVHVQNTMASWAPSKKVLQEEEMCRNHHTRPKRDLRGVALKIHPIEHDPLVQSQSRVKLQQRLIMARAMLKPVTDIPPVISHGISAWPQLTLTPRPAEHHSGSTVPLQRSTVSLAPILHPVTPTPLNHVTTHKPLVISLQTTPVYPDVNATTSKTYLETTVVATTSLEHGKSVTTPTMPKTTEKVTLAPDHGIISSKPLMHHDGTTLPHQAVSSYKPTVPHFTTKMSSNTVKFTSRPYIVPTSTSLSLHDSTTLSPTLIHETHTTKSQIVSTTKKIFPPSTKMSTTTTPIPTTTTEPPPFTTLPITWTTTHPLQILTTPMIPHITHPYLPVTTVPPLDTTPPPQISTTSHTVGKMSTSNPFIGTTETVMTSPAHGIVSTEPTTTKATTTSTTRKSTTTTTTTEKSASTTPVIPTVPCHTHSNLCSCHKAHCGFNTATNKCENVTSICKQQRFSPTECIRHPKGHEAEVYYIYGGVACSGKENKSRRNRSTNNGVGGTVSKNCEVDQTILAVNLGRDQTHVDSNGIQYFADNEIPWKDPHGTRKTDVSLHLTGVDKTDQWLYRWQIWGDWNKAKPGRCVTYVVALTRDGEYELNLKMIDNYWRRKGTRGFNVRFNGVTILPELDLIEVTKQQFKAVDLVLNFQVKHQGTKLEIPGYSASTIVDGDVTLAFCYGECHTTDEDYHVAGFSVVRFVSKQEVISSTACHHFRRLPCLCKRSGCEYNVETGDCRLLEVCSGAMFHHDECQRSNAFYSDGGVLCRNPHDRGNCQIKQVVLAVNLNGRTFTDSKGITYETDNQVAFEDPSSTRSTGESRECLGVTKEERELYCNYMEGINSKADTNHCIEFPIQITSDGDYELTIKMGEFNHDSQGDRSFNIKINGEIVIKEMDLLTITEKNQPINLILLLTVMGSGKVVWIKGHALRRVPEGVLKLGFCYGSWRRKVTTWTVSAFSLVRFAQTFRNISEYSFSV